MMKIKSGVIIFIFICICTQAYSYIPIPDPRRSPGKLCSRSDPHFEEMRYSGKVAYCRRVVSTQLKEQIKNKYGISRRHHGDYIIDHIIPLSIGGSNDIKNLWPQHQCIQEATRSWELSLYHRVRRGELTQDAAVREVLSKKYDDSLRYAPCRGVARK